METIEKISFSPVAIEAGGGVAARSAVLFFEETHRGLRELGVKMSPESSEVKISDKTNGFMMEIMTKGSEYDKKLELHIDLHGIILFGIFLKCPIINTWEEVDGWEYLHLPLEKFEEKFHEIAEALK